MLDKSIDYKHIIMRASARDVAGVVPAPLPEGYAFRFFAEGDADNWARIETSVHEFNSEREAADYFVRDYLPYAEKLKKRLVFVVNSEMVPVATANAWFSESDLGRQATLQWVAAMPECQGKGIGKAVVSKALSLFPALEPGMDVYLHTQTWSHKAVVLYHNLGFRMLKTGLTATMREAGLGPVIHPNEFGGAIEILKTVLSADQVEKLVETAV